MVVLAASICTKGGKAVISRQFRDMSRTRIESLLASFPKLIPTTATQHTTIETTDVRYVYQPLEDLYILLITNKASNILQDIDTLHLFARVVSDMCRTADEREILVKAFEILGAFDEVVSQGYREQVGLAGVRSVLEMESHEEKIQEIIARNKEAEAKEELKRRAKQLEMQRREQQRRTASGAPGGATGYLGGGISGYSPVPRFEAPVSTPSSTPSSTTRTPAFKSSGMKLGSKKTKQAELLDALGGEVLAASVASLDISAPSTPAITTPTAAKSSSGRGSLPEVEPESIHITTRETLSLSLLRDGGVSSLELKGDMNLLINDAASAHVRVILAPFVSPLASGLQLKQHPNVAKFPAGVASGAERVVALKDPSKPFPVSQSLAVLKWRYVGTDESAVPVSVNCWPSVAGGNVEVSIEYEIEEWVGDVVDLVIEIPLPPGSYPTIASNTGTWAVTSSHALAWSAEEGERTGSIVFSVPGDDEDVGGFFPVRVSFIAQGSLAGIAPARVEAAVGGGEMPYSVDGVVEVGDYLVV